MRSRALLVGVLLQLALGLVTLSACSADVEAEGTSVACLVLADSVIPTGVEVTIDIRPGSERNPVNPKSNGVLPVAILSSATFDATQADPGTIYLEGVPVSSPSGKGKFQACEEDIDGDGLTDLKVKIDVELLDLAVPTGTATLVGETFAGEPFWGMDTYTIVPPDVANDSWALLAVAACIQSKIVFGYPDDLYHPEMTVTRAQMAAFIGRALAGGESAVPKAKGKATFGDVSPSHWAYQYVQYIGDAGIVQGYPDGTYQPEQTMTRAQMAAFIARSVAARNGEDGPAGYQAPETPTFGDVATDAWCYGDVEYLAEQGVVSGYDDATYRPDDNVKRDQMAVYIARAFELTM